MFWIWLYFVMYFCLYGLSKVLWRVEAPFQRFRDKLPIVLESSERKKQFTTCSYFWLHALWAINPTRQKKLCLAKLWPATCYLTLHSSLWRQVKLKTTGNEKETSIVDRVKIIWVRVADLFHFSQSFERIRDNNQLIGQVRVPPIKARVWNGNNQGNRG